MPFLKTLKAKVLRQFEPLFNHYKIYVYHRVCPDVSKDRLSLKVSCDLFENHLQYFKKNHRVHFVDELVAKRFRGKNKKDISITFDDGCADLYNYAFPLLKKYELPATIFINTGFIEKPEVMWWDMLLEHKERGDWPAHEPFTWACQRMRFLSHEERESLIEHHYALPKDTLSSGFIENNRLLNWSEIQEMHDSGLVRFEPHTHTHTCLKFLSETDIRSEIQQSKKILEKKLGRECKTFAYPYGSPTDMDAKAIHVLKTLGFEAAFLVWGKSNTKLTDPFHLDRIQKRDLF